MIPRWMFPSRVQILRTRSDLVDGVLTVTFEPVLGLAAAELVDGVEVVPMRLEVGFYRPGKDAPLPVQAGRAPDRVAVYWCFPETDVRPGDQLRMVSGPVIGSWHVRTYPDRAIDMNKLHHLEGQCVEMIGQRGDA